MHVLITINILAIELHHAVPISKKSESVKLHELYEKKCFYNYLIIFNNKH